MSQQVRSIYIVNSNNKNVIEQSGSSIININEKGCGLSYNNENLFLPNFLTYKSTDIITYNVFEISTGLHLSYKTNDYIVQKSTKEYLKTIDYFLRLLNYVILCDYKRGLFSIYNVIDNHTSIINALGKQPTNIIPSVSMITYHNNPNECLLLFYCLSSNIISNQSNAVIKALYLPTLSVIEIKLDIKVFQEFDSNLTKQKSLKSFQSIVILNIECHRNKPIILLTIQTSNKHNYILLYRYNQLINRLNKFKTNTIEQPTNNDIDDDQSTHNDNESISESASVTSANKRNSLLFSRKSIVINDFTPFAMIKPIADNFTDVTNVCMNKSGELISVIWNNQLTSVYVLKTFELDESIKVFQIKPMSSNLSKYIISSNCFHSHEPILLQHVVIESKQKIRILSLLLDKVNCINEDDFSNISPFNLLNNQITIQCSNNTGRFIISFINQYKCLVYIILTFSQLFQSNYCINRSIISSFQCPPDAYIDGDQVVRKDELLDKSSNDKARSSFPLVLAIKPNSMIASTIDSPIVTYTYQLFRCEINFNTQSNKTSTFADSKHDFTQFIGSINCSKNTLFIPTEIKADYLKFYGSYWIPEINEIKSSDNVIWEAILKGRLVTSSLHDDMTTNIPVIYILNYNNQNTEEPLKIDKTSFRDADYWNGASESVRVSSDQFKSSILALDESGLFVTWLLNRQLDSINERWSLPEEMSRLWTGPLGVYNVVTYATAVPINSLQRQSIILSLHKSALISTDSPKFTLLSGEFIFDLIWQSVPSAHSYKPVINNLTTIDPKFMEQKVWLTQYNGLVGIRTNKRVMILSSKLELINEHYQIMSKPENQSIISGYINDSISSIYWVGCSLVYLTESGVLSYLLPIQTFSDLTMKPLNPSTYHKLQSIGLSIDDYKSGNLIFLSKFKYLNSGVSLSTRIICCLPNRLIIGLSDITKINNEIDIITVPITFVEPLCLGLLIRFNQLNDKNKKDTLLNERILTLAKLISMYFPWIRKNNNSSNAINYPSSHVTNKLAIVLVECGFYQLSALVSGLPPKLDNHTSRSLIYNNSSAYPQLRWLNNATRFDISIKSERSYLSGTSLLSGVESGGHELVDGYVDSNSYSGLLPFKYSFISICCSIASRILINNGYIDESIKLADLAGDEELLVKLLKSKDKYDRKSTTIGSNLTTWKKLVSIDKVNRFLSHDINDKIINNIEMNQLYDVKRRSTLLNLSTDSTATNSNNIDNELIIVVKVLTTDVINDFGPSSMLGKLAADAVEDWLGMRVAPDTLTTTTNQSLFNTLTKNTNTNQSKSVSSNLGNNNQTLPNGLTTRPITWIDGIGVGSKDNELCVGYWRFSDYLYPNSSLYLTSNQLPPYTRLNFIDLSKFGSINDLSSGINILELFSLHSNDIQLIHSTSPVDPGEEHEKTKLLLDVVYSGASDCGMKIVIGRGGPLDIGLLHTDIVRNKMTIEFYIYYCFNNKNKIILLERLVSTLDSCLYSLYIDESGYLILCYGNSLDKDSHIKSRDVCFDVNGDNQWYHIAVTIETYGNLSNVILYINCNEVANNKITIPSTVILIDEQSLELTSLFIGKNLPNNFRITELRIWSEVKSSDSLEENKENYLTMASKRRRQQRSMKGTKELFSTSLSDDLSLPNDELVVSNLSKSLDKSKLTITTSKENDTNGNVTCSSDIVKTIVLNAPQPVTALRSSVAIKKVNFNESQSTIQSDSKPANTNTNSLNDNTTDKIEDSNFNNLKISNNSVLAPPSAIKSNSFALGSLPPSGAPRVRPRPSQSKD